MKTKIYIVASMIACCGLCSCNDLIDIYPVENNVADKFYSSEFEINQAVMGVYARLGRNGGSQDFPTIYYFMASEGRSDNLYYAALANAQRDQVDLRNFAVTDVTGTNEDIYARLYQIIADANMLLERTPEHYVRYRAEASFLRALAYFELVRAYGPQPVVDRSVLNEDAKKMDRQPIEDIYKLIISDLEYAGNNLEALYGRGSWSRRFCCCKMLVGRGLCDYGRLSDERPECLSESGDYFRADYGSGQNKICTGLFVYF